MREKMVIVNGTSFSETVSPHDVTLAQANVTRCGDVLSIRDREKARRTTGRGSVNLTGGPGLC